MVFLLVTVITFRLIEPNVAEGIPPDGPRKPLLASAGLADVSPPTPSADAVAIADIARRVAALDARLSSLPAFQPAAPVMAVPLTTESPVPSRLSAVSQQLEQLTLLATLHFASEADKRLGMAGVATALPTVSVTPSPPPPPPPPSPPLEQLKNELKSEIQDAKKVSTESSDKANARLTSLEERLTKLFAQQNERFSHLLQGSKDGDPIAKKKAEVDKQPLHGKNGHVCRTPPCSRNMDTCKLNQNCCSDLMFDMLVDFTDWLVAHNITYHITAGTLLGAVRDNDIIPYTSDADIVIPKEFWDKVKEINKEEGVEKSYSFMQDPQEGNCGRVCPVWKGLPVNSVSFEQHFDWDTEKEGGDVSYYMDVYSEQMDFVIALDNLNYPLSNVTIRNHTFKAPREPELWCEASYGSGWRIPDHRAHGGEPGKEYPSLQDARHWSEGALILRKARKDAALAHRLLERATVDHSSGKVMVDPVGAKPAEYVHVRSLALPGFSIGEGGKVLAGEITFLPPDPGETEVTHYTLYWLVEKLHGWTPALERLGSAIMEIPRCAAGEDPFQACGKNGQPRRAALPRNATAPLEATHFGVACRNEAGESSNVVEVPLPGSGMDQDSSAVTFSRRVSFGVLGAIDSTATDAATCVPGREALVRHEELEGLVNQMLKKTSADMQAGFHRLGLWLGPLATALRNCKSPAAGPLLVKFNTSLQHFISPASFVYTPMKALDIDNQTVFLGINIAIGAMKKEDFSKFGTAVGDMLRPFSTLVPVTTALPTQASSTLANASAVPVNTPQSQSEAGKLLLRPRR